MATVGEQLRVAREGRGLGISEVANATNIKSDYIRAMEAGETQGASLLIPDPDRSAP